MTKKLSTLLLILILTITPTVVIANEDEAIYDEARLLESNETEQQFPALNIPQNISPHRPHVYINGFPILSIDMETPIDWDVTTPALGWLRANWQDNATLNVSNTSIEFQLNNINVSVRGRGNSTWLGFGSTKRPLRFRFPTGEWRHMFDSGYVGRDWILLANVMDPSHLRTFAPFYLGKLLKSMHFVPNSWFVHLYLDGEYRGVYQLVDERDANFGRGHLNLDEDPTISEYMIEFDMRVANSDSPVNTYWVQTSAGPFEIRFPSNFTDEADNPHATYVEDFINRANEAISSGDSTETAAIIDVESFVDFYLVQEFMKNIDIGFSSVFYQIRGVGDYRRLYAGPLWDFDLSSGSANNYPTYWAEDIDEPWGEWAAATNRWFRILLNTPWFREEVRNRWAAIRDDEVLEMLDRVQYMAVTFENEFQRDDERWPSHGNYSWNSSTVANLTTAMENAEFLHWWFTERIEWMNAWLEIPDARSVTVNEGSVSGYFEPSTTVEISANDPAKGYEFSHWIADNDVGFADYTDADTTFVMPARNVIVSAVFEPMYMPAQTPAQSILAQAAAVAGSMLLTGGFLVTLGLTVVLGIRKK